MKRSVSPVCIELEVVNLFCRYGFIFCFRSVSLFHGVLFLNDAFGSVAFKERTVCFIKSYEEGKLIQTHTLVSKGKQETTAVP